MRCNDCKTKRPNALNHGKLDRKITIQQKVTTTDSEGISTETWSALKAPIWAAREPLRGREFFEAATTNAEKTVRYKIRYRSGSGIEEEMQLIDARDGKTYRIFALLDDVYGDREETHLMTEELSGG